MVYSAEVPETSEMTFVLTYEEFSSLVLSCAYLVHMRASLNEI